MMDYLKEVKKEFKHVVWPSRTQVWFYTGFVIAISFVIAYYLGLFDLIFGKALELAI